MILLVAAALGSVLAQSIVIVLLNRRLARLEAYYATCAERSHKAEMIVQTAQIELEHLHPLVRSLMHDLHATRLRLWNLEETAGIISLASHPIARNSKCSPPLKAPNHPPT